MINRTWAGLAATLFAFILASPDSADASEWQPRLEPVSGAQFRGPTTPFEIYIPPEAPAESLPRLALELDTIDVTGFIDNKRAPIYVFQPIQALSFGPHQLRLVEYTPDGDIIERAVWDVEVRKSKAFREAALGINGNLSLIRRVADDDNTALPDKDTATGSLALDARVANGDWRGTAYIPLMFDEAATERKGEVGDFLFTSTQGPVVVQAGHHAIPSDSLVASGVYNRGISATASTADQGQSVTGFVMRSSPISGAREGLGVGDSDDRVNGVVWTGYPVRTDGRYVEVSAVYVDGEGPADGSSVVGDPTITGGKAWSLRADAGWKNNRFRLRGEYAGSEYDFDGDGGYDPEKDNAVTALFSYRPWEQKYVDDQPMDLSFNIEHRRIGPFFTTPAGQAPTTDRDMIRGFVNFSWAALRIDASLSQEETNVDGNSLLPTDQTDIASASINYSPPPSDDPEKPYGLWGQQNYRLTLTNQQDETKVLPVGYAGSGNDSTTDTLSIGADFLHERWSWGVAHDLIEYEDVTNFNPDTRDTQTQLQATFNVSDTFSLSPRVQVGRLRYEDTGVVTRERIAGVNLNYNPTDRWSTHLSVDVNRSKVSDDSANTETQTVTAGVTWTAIPPKTNRPGVTLTIDGSKTDTTDNIDPTLSTDTYQVFFRVNVGWSALY